MLMNTLWLLFEIAVNLFQGWLYTFFLQRQLTRKANLSPTRFSIATIGTIFSVASFYSLYIWFDIPITDSVIFIATFAYSTYCFQEKWHIKLLWNIILGVVMVAIASFMASLIINVAGVSWEMLMEPSLLRLSYILLGNAVLFTAYYIITRIRPRQEKLSWFALALFLALNIVLLIAMEVQYNLSWQESVPRSPVLITILCLLFVIAGLLAMFELLSYKADKQAELELQISTSQLMETHFEEMKSMYQNMREYQHDMKHQLDALQAMIDDGKLQESTAYLQQLRKVSLPVRFATGCIAVDALLSTKVAYMKQLDIEFSFIPYPLNELPLPEPSFCSVIGNLLDNAIEAVTRAQDGGPSPNISLSFARVRDMLYITCKNTANPETIHRKGIDFLSSKRTGKTGHGISSIRHTVEQAEGYCSFELVDSIFTAVVVLPFKS